jgi:cobalt ECF transporter T component CbiQ
VEKTLQELADSARDTLFAEKWARREGLLQRLDPRVKIAAFFGFVLLTAFLHRAPALVGLYLLTLALAALSRLPLKILFKRVWLSVPLFVGAATLPASLHLVTPGPALLVLSREPYLAITAPGLAAAGLLTLRVGVAISFVALLTLTTRWNDLLRGLRVLFVPKLFLAVLAMTYRYLAVLAQAASELFMARRSRTVGRTSLREDRRFLGGAVGALFGRTLALTDEVHAAMLSRGWTGETVSLRPLRLRMEDALWLGAMGLCAAASIWLERMSG